MSRLPYRGSSTDPPSVVGLSDLSGQQIGRYLVQGRIGSGGVATVYQAYDQVLGRSVALKILLPHSDQSTHSRFRREAMMAGSLRHPHIVRILQVGNAFQGGVAYIAMELVEGESLATLLTQYGQLGQEESCSLLEPVARALAFAHLNGIVHRDVKPSNILLSPVNPGTANSVQLDIWEYPVVPLLSDFGIARFLDAPELTNTGRTVGTPAFMAPEQCTGSRELDGRTDVYALGTVLFRCITGKLPYSGSMTKVLHAHVYEPLIIDTSVLEWLSPQVLQILQRSLAKNPDERYPSVEEMATDLAEAARQVASPRMAGKDESEFHPTATLSVAAVAAGEDDTGKSSMSSSVTVLIPAPGTMTDSLVEAQSRDSVTGVGEDANGDLDTLAEGAGSGQRQWAKSVLYWIALPLVVLLLVILFYPALLGWFGWVVDPQSSSTGLAESSFESGIILADVSPTLNPTLSPTVTAANNGVAAAMLPTATPSLVPLEPQTPVALPTVTEVVLPPATPTEPPVAASPTVEPVATLPLSDEDNASGTPLGEVVEIVTTVAVDLQTPEPVTPVPQVETAPDNDDSGIVSVCTNVVDEFFANAVLTLSAEDRSDLECPMESAYTTGAEILPFENGFMARLDEDPSIYVYYEQSQAWEQRADIVREVEPVDSGSIPPGMFVPQQAYGRLWQQERRRTALGFALQQEPTRFDAIVQKFPGAILIGNKNSDAVYAFVVSRLQL